MKIIVMSREKARRWSYEAYDKVPTAIISITDPHSPINRFACEGMTDAPNGIQAVLRLQFADVNRGSPDCITAEDAEKVVKFVNEQKDKVQRLIVHCEAGQSRSAGVAAAILKYLTGSDTQIYDDPKYTPNSTCYREVLNKFYEEENT